MGDDGDSDLGVFDDLVERREREREVKDPAKDKSGFSTELTPDRPDASVETRVEGKHRPPMESQSTLPGMGPDGKLVPPMQPKPPAAPGLGAGAAPPPPPPKPPPPKGLMPLDELGDDDETRALDRPLTTLAGIGQGLPKPAALPPPPGPPPPAPRTLLGMGPAPKPSGLVPRSPPGGPLRELEARPPPPPPRTDPVLDRRFLPPTPSPLRGAPPPTAGAPPAPASAPRAPVSAPPARPSARPLPPPPRVAPADLDWEDEEEPDEITRIVGREKAVRADAQALAKRRRKLLMVVLGSVAAAAVVLLVAFVLPKTGSLVVTVSGPEGAAVDGVRVIVDGKLRCQQSPCRVKGVSAGAHSVAAEAPGYARPADRAVVVESGSDKVVDFALAPRKGGTGVKVGALGKDLHLFVDGKDRGLLPVTVNDLEAGKHTIRIAGSSSFAPHEERIILEEGQMLQLEPKLDVKKRLAKLEAGTGADGAQVLLICGDDKQLILDLPKTVEIDPERDCRLKATREGYLGFSTDLAFEEGEAEKTFQIALAEEEEAEEAEPGGRLARLAGLSKKGKKGKKGKKAKKAKKGKKGKPPPAGMGTISMNSIPPSSVLLDGRPVGRTPTRVNASAGRHSVVFMHPERGRRAVGVNVKPGRNSVAAVRFK